MIAKMLVYFTQAYLSLPEGAATAAGLIAMMTDHYSNLVIFYLFSHFLHASHFVIGKRSKIANWIDLTGRKQ